MSFILMTVRRKVGIPAQASQDCGALVTWNSCVRLLCPASLFPSRNRSAEQPTVHTTPFQVCSDSHVSHIECVPSPSEPVSPLSLLPAEHLPSLNCTREETVRAREGWADVLCLLLSSFSPVLLLFTPFLSYSLPVDYCAPGLPLSATADHWVAKEREECKGLAAFQAIVPGGPLSVVKPPDGCHLAPFFSFSHYTVVTATCQILFRHDFLCYVLYLYLVSSIIWYFYIVFNILQKRLICFLAKSEMRRSISLVLVQKYEATGWNQLS